MIMKEQKCLMNSGLETKSCFSFENKEVKSLTVDLKMHIRKFLMSFIKYFSCTSFVLSYVTERVNNL